MKRSLVTGALLAALAVILGAFGAHGLKEALGPDHLAQLQSYETAVRYQMYHAFALILVGIAAKIFGEGKLLNAAYTLFVLGIFFFSGSIYILSTRTLTGLDWTWVGPLTPLGGICFLAGWIMLAISFSRKTAA